MRLFISLLIYALVGLAVTVFAMFLTNGYIQNGKVNDKKSQETITLFSVGKRSIIEACILTLSAAGVGISAELYAKDFITRLVLIIVMALLIIAAVFDGAIWIIPNFVPLCILISKIGFLIYDFVTKEDFFLYVIDCVLGGTVCFLVFYIAGRVTKRSVGGGDIKIICALGFLLGLETTIEIIIIALVSAIAYAMTMVGLKRRTLKDYIPFAPYIYIGFLFICYVMIR